MIINDLAVVDESYNFDLVTATTSLYFLGIIRQWIQLVAIPSFPELGISKISMLN